MASLKPLTMPVDLPIWAVGTLKVRELELQAMLGEPHYVETDSTRTCGGEEQGWAYALPSGQRLLIVLAVPVSMAELYCDPPDMGPALAALGIAADDPRLVHHEPVEMR
jgi:hypothetical protein